jgi:hypothetical protein
MGVETVHICDFIISDFTTLIRIDYNSNKSYQDVENIIHSHEYNSFQSGFLQFQAE